MDDETRSATYADLRQGFPELFANPPGADYEILLDPVEVAAAERDYAGELARYGFPAVMAETGVVYMDPFVMILRDAVRRPSGALGTYIRTVASGNASGVVILPVYHGRIVLVRHFRHATRDWQWEIPRGFGRPGSEPDADALRELHEEIGIDKATLHDLGAIYPDTGMTGTPVRLFLAKIDNEPRAADTEEGISEIRMVSPSELGDLIGNETIKDGFTINAYARAILRGLISSGGAINGDVAKRKLDRYDRLRAERPDQFVNPPGAAIQIVLDRAEQLAAGAQAAEEFREAGRPVEFADMGVAYEDPYIILVRDAVRFRDGRVGAYIREFGTDPGTGSAILPILPDGRVVLIKHFRHGIRGWQWEIPRGFSENGSDGATTAAREIAEELGVENATIEFLGRTTADGNYDEIYLAFVDQMPDALPEDASTEGIDSFRFCTPGELTSLISDGDITDEYTLAAWALAKAKQKI